MANEHFSNSNKDQVIAPSYGDLIFMWEKISNAYDRLMKKNSNLKRKHLILGKSFGRVERLYNND